MDIAFILERMNTFNDAIALICEDQKYTYLDVLEEYRKAKRILEKHCIAENSIVALIADFMPQSIAMFLALIEKNTIIVPISPAVKNKNLYLEIAQCEYIIDMLEYIHVKGKNNEKLEALTTQRKIEQIRADEPITTTESSVDVLAQTSIQNISQKITKHALLVKLKEENVGGLILFSSGTTGEPKAAVHNMQNLLDKFRTQGKKLSTICFLLFDHIGGFNTMMHSLCNGGMIATIKTRDPNTICALIEKHAIELLPTSPTFLNLLLLNKTYENYDLSSLKIISYGTEPMPESTLRTLYLLLPHVQLKQTYGLSELGIIPTKSESSSSLWLQLREEDSLKIKIVDDILFIKTKSPMLGYLNAPSPFDEEGWFNTKDKVLVKDNFIKILGRTTDIVIIGGEKVYPIEVESVFLEHEKVLDIFVYGVENPIMGHVLEAKVLVHEENANRHFIKELRSFAKNFLESYKIPARFIFTTENLHSERFKKNR